MYVNVPSTYPSLPFLTVASRSPFPRAGHLPLRHCPCFHTKLSLTPADPSYRTQKRAAAYHSLTYFAPCVTYSIIIRKQCITTNMRTPEILRQSAAMPCDSTKKGKEKRETGNGKAMLGLSTNGRISSAFWTIWRECADYDPERPGKSRRLEARTVGIITKYSTNFMLHAFILHAFILSSCFLHTRFQGKDQGRNNRARYFRTD
ncbi:hypothetical protein ACMFMF_000727 [Clarireedia jacksonii]